MRQETPWLFADRRGRLKRAHPGVQGALAAAARRLLRLGQSHARTSPNKVNLSLQPWIKFEPFWRATAAGSPAALRQGKQLKLIALIHCSYVVLPLQPRIRNAICPSIAPKKRAQELRGSGQAMGSMKNETV